MTEKRRREQPGSTRGQREGDPCVYIINSISRCGGVPLTGLATWRPNTAVLINNRDTPLPELKRVHHHVAADARVVPVKLVNAARRQEELAPAKAAQKLRKIRYHLLENDRYLSH
jgi:hypothetical protein